MLCCGYGKAKIGRLFCYRIEECPHNGDEVGLMHRRTFGHQRGEQCCFNVPCLRCCTNCGSSIHVPNVSSETITLDNNLESKVTSSSNMLQQSIVYEENSLTDGNCNLQEDSNYNIYNDVEPIESKGNFLEQITYVQELLQPLFIHTDSLQRNRDERNQIYKKIDDAPLSNTALITILSVIALTILLWVALGFLYALLVAFFGFFIIKLVYVITNDKEESKVLSQIQPELDANEAEYQSILVSLADYMDSKAYTYVCDYIPEDYLNINTIDQLSKYAKNKRADSLKEALNLFETDIAHEQNMRIQREQSAMLLQNLENQKEMTQHQKAILARLKENNNLSKINAAASMQYSSSAREMAKKLK